MGDRCATLVKVKGNEALMSEGNKKIENEEEKFEVF